LFQPKVRGETPKIFGKNQNFYGNKIFNKNKIFLNKNNFSDSKNFCDTNKNFSHKNLNNINKNLDQKNFKDKLKINHKNFNNKICKNNPKFPTQKLSYYTRGTSEKDSNITCWTIDSGASNHMTNNKNGLHDIKEHEEYISFANGDIIKSTHIGTYKGYINHNLIVLNNVLYVPEFKRSLLSIDSLSQKHYKTIFYRDNNQNLVTIINKRGNKICTVAANSIKVYRMWTTIDKPVFKSNNKVCDSLTKIDDKMQLWHRRLGHFYIEKLKSKLQNIEIKESCQICTSSKLQNKPYYPSNNRATEPFELIHMDTVTIDKSSMYKNKYILTILDDYTRYGWVIFTNSKDKIFNSFLKWYKKVKNIFNKTIKYIRTDNGTEFKNSQFNDFCNNEGIIQQFTVPYNPQQNGRSERFNRTLINSAKAILKEAKLNGQFWEDAVSTANYIHNRIPHNSIDQQVPYELLFNDKVDYNKFKVFGCLAFYYVPKQLRKKLNNSTSPGIFIGYDDINHTAYKIYDFYNNKIITSRAVEFYEDTFPNVSAPPSYPSSIPFSPFFEVEGETDDIQENYDTPITTNINNNNTNFNTNHYFDTTDTNKLNSPNLPISNQQNYFNNFNQNLSQTPYYPNNLIYYNNIPFSHYQFQPNGHFYDQNLNFQNFNDYCNEVYS